MLSFDAFVRSIANSCQTVEMSFLEKPAFDYVLKPIGGETFGFDIGNVSLGRREFDLLLSTTGHRFLASLRSSARQSIPSLLR